MTYKQFYNQFGIYLGAHTWMLHMFVIIVVTGLVSFLSGKIIERMSKRAKHRHQHWKRVFLSALNTPLRVFFAVIGLTYALDIARVVSENPILMQFVTPLRQLGIIACLLWFVVRFIHKSENYYLRHRKDEVDITTVHAIGKLVRISTIFLGLLIVLQTIGISVSGVLAFGGIGGLAIGFAAKDLLANFFGGLVLYMDRPFNVGEWIQSPDKQLEGTVEAIGWRLTRIRTFDKRSLYIPNAAFLSIIVVNATRMKNRRIKKIIGVRYDDWKAIPKITEDVEAMLKSHPDIDHDQKIFLRLVEFNQSSLDMQLYAFTRDTEWINYQEVQQDVLVKIMEIIDGHGAECAFPTTTLHIPDTVEIHKTKG